MTGLDALGPDPVRLDVATPGWRPRLIGDRIVPVARLFPDGKAPADVVTVAAGSGQQVALCCPLTAVPLTTRMTSAVGISAEQVEAMVQRRAPLGLTPAAWQDIRREVETSLFGARSLPTVGRPPLQIGDGDLQVAIGGSAVGCFSSVKTVLEKKHFPADEAELDRMIRASPLNRGLDDRRLSSLVEDAITLSRSLELGDRVPRAPWFNILNALGIEEAADLDLQIHADVLDKVMTERSLMDPGIGERLRSDRLGRWNEVDVLEAFPELATLLFRLSRYVALHFEFLGPQGGTAIQTRNDWWRMIDHHGGN